MRIKQKPEDFVVEEIFTVKHSGSGAHSWFWLEKRDIGTIEAIQALSKAWSVPAKSFGISGLKDKNAVTRQVCSAKLVAKEKIESSMLKNIKTEFIGQSDSPVRLGMHSGNKFEIAVRHIDALPKPRKEFVNYFGKQRFSSKNDEIGRAIVKKQWQKAIELIAETSAEQGEKMKAHIAMHENDHIGALRILPLKILKIYVHAYQSRLWNDIVKEHELAGDLHATIPIVGFGSDVSDALVQKQLREEGITPRDFVMKAFPELSQEGSDRKTTVETKDLEIGKLDEDELNPGQKKTVIKFILPPGSYATEIIRQLFQQSH